MSPDPERGEEFHVEHDSMGEVQVPKDAKWGAQTQRAVENFPISGETLPPNLIAALARIKAAVARVKLEGGMIEPDLARAIIEAAEAVAAGSHGGQFPIDIFQTGSGTSSNMNMNEVLATIAGEELGRPVHPNDDVNHPLSSNDMFPASIHLAATDAVVGDLIPALNQLAEALATRASWPPCASK
jgi:fumarate hydratase class II